MQSVFIFDPCSSIKDFACARNVSHFSRALDEQPMACAEPAGLLQMAAGCISFLSILCDNHPVTNCQNYYALNGGNDASDWDNYVAAVHQAHILRKERKERLSTHVVFHFFFK